MSVKSAFVALSLFALACSGLSTRLDADTEECYSTAVRHGSQASFSFVVTAGGQQEVDARLFSRHLRPQTDAAARKGSLDVKHTLSADYQVTTRDLREWTRASSGSHSHTVPHNAIGTDHELVACLSNKHSKWTPKWVSFQFNQLDVGEAQVNEMGYTPDEVEREARVHAAAQKIYRIQQDIERIKTVEQGHRDTVESTNAWLGYGSLINCLLLIGMSVFQYWYLTHFLAVRHASARM